MTGIRPLALLVLAAAVAALAWWVHQRPGMPGAADPRPQDGRVAVETAAVVTGAVSDVREFTGTLEAGDAFTVAPKIGGQIMRIHVDVGDRVERGQVVVELDDDEARQGVAEAEAELAVARAELEQARADARLSERELERTHTLAQRELASGSELDTARARAEAQRTAVAVATARVEQRDASLARARVQLGYTSVRADWAGDDTTRLVGERMVNAGDTVAANTPLLTVLRIAPLTAVVHASESDYPSLRTGQSVEVTADALPGRAFTGEIARIAPRFAADSRQARFEVTLANEDRALKPGMFVTVRVTVDRATEATLVPAEAIVRRESGSGVYRVVEGDPPRARFERVRLGIEGNGRVQVLEPGLSGRVVTLGQQMLEDGAPVIVAEPSAS